MSGIDELVAAKDRESAAAFEGGVIMALQWVAYNPEEARLLLGDPERTRHDELDALLAQLRSEWKAAVVE